MDKVRIDRRWLPLNALRAFEGVARYGSFTGAAGALTLFVVQLVANALWSWIFFAWHRGGIAFAEIIVLLVLIVATMIGFARVHRVAALLLVPYLGWVLFASALTLSVWRANLDRLG